MPCNFKYMEFFLDNVLKRRISGRSQLHPEEWMGRQKLEGAGRAGRAGRSWKAEVGKN